jgi:hypothetical protein
LTEITRRYYATAIALARAMGLPMSEDFLRQHRESISCCYIEAGRAGVRLPPAVQLPPLAPTNGDTPLDTTEMTDIHCTGMPTAPEEPPTNGHPSPLAIPKDVGLPCGGQVIADLKPAQLAMLIARAANLVHEQGEAWVPLLGSLQLERAKRLERGRTPRRPEGAADGT